MWDKVLEVLGEAAPTVGGLLGGPGGAAVGELVSKVLGVDNSPEAIEKELVNNPDALVKIKELETNKALAILKTQYDTMVEGNRHEEYYTGTEVQDKQNARAAAALGPVQTDIAKRIYVQSAWGIPVLLVLNALLIVMTPKLGIDTTAIVALGNLIGIALSNQFRERQSVIEFLFGSSIEKKVGKQ